MKSKLSKWSLLALALVGALIVGFALPSSNNDSETEGDDPVVKSATAVTLTNLKTIEVDDEFLAIGKVVPESSYEVATALGGKVTKINVKEGQKITKGQVLYELDQATLLNNKVQTERSLKSAISTLEDQVKATEKQLVKLTDQIQKLKEQKTAPIGQASQTAAATLVQLDAQMAQLEGTQETLKATLTTIKRQLGDAKANYATQVKNLESSISDRILRSPADGIVTGITFKVGELIGPQDVLKIVSDNAFAVESPITASQLRQLEDATEQNQLEIRLLLEGDKNRQIKATQLKSDVVQNPQTNLYHIRVALDSIADSANSENLVAKLYEGEYVEIRFSTARRSVQSLPLAAIKRLGSDAFAYYVEDSVAKRVPVTLGTISGELVELVSGVDDFSKETQWVLKGIDDLQDGASVKASK